MRRAALRVVLVTAVACGLWYAAYRYLILFRHPDVPFVTTPPDVVAAMLDLAEVKDGDLVYDLGCGDGRIAIAAAQRPGVRALGVDIDPRLVAESRKNAGAAGVADRTEFRHADVFEMDYRPASVIAFFLQSTVNARLRPTFAELPPGRRIVSHMFMMPGAKPTKTVTVKSEADGLEHTIHLWVTPLEWEPHPLAVTD